MHNFNITKYKHGPCKKNLNGVCTLYTKDSLKVLCEEVNYKCEEEEDD